MILVCIEYNLYLCARYLLFASKQKPVSWNHVKKISMQCSIYQDTPPTMGLTGFDSGLKRYVSMWSQDGRLLNLCYQEFIWRNTLRSRCLIEAQ